MVCPNCSATNPDGQTFCGNCGQQMTETVGSVSERLSRVETTLAASRNGVTQHNLEIETSTNVMERVRKWTTLILFFAGIPAAIALLALAIVFGKGALNLHDIAAHAQESVKAILAQAQTEGGEAVRTANEALATSRQVDADIKGTKALVSNLKTEIDTRSAEVQKLGEQIKTSQQKVEELNKTVQAQSQQFQHVTEQARAVQTAKNVAGVQNVYPIFGQHVARNVNGWINPKQKTPGMRYVYINLSLTATPNVSDAKVAEAITALNNKNYTVTMGNLYTYAVAASNAQAVGMGLDANSCMYWVVPAKQVPCILYFRENLKDSAIEVRNLIKVAQEVSDAQLFYVDPKQLDAQKRELLDLSAVDIVVVLGQQ
jgi:TolA-binding protein